MRFFRPKQTISKEIATIAICVFVLLIGLASDFCISHNHPCAKVLVYLDDTFYRSLLIAIVSIQASIMCIGFSFIAIVSNFNTEEYLGIKYFNYVLRYRNKILSFKNTLILEFLLIVLSVSFAVLEYLNSVFACFISSIILLSYLFIDILELIDTNKLHNSILEFLKLNICNADYDFLEKYVSWTVSAIQEKEPATKQNCYYADELWISCADALNDKKTQKDKDNTNELIKRINNSFSNLVKEYLKNDTSIELNSKGIELCKSIMTTYCNKLDNENVAERCIHNSMKVWAPFLSSLYININKKEDIEQIRKTVFCWEKQTNSSREYSSSRMLLDSIIMEAKKEPDKKTYNILTHRAEILLYDALSSNNSCKEYDEAIHFILNSAREGFISVIEDVCFSNRFHTIQEKFPQLINTVVAYLFYIAFLEDEKIIQAEYKSMGPRTESIRILSHGFRMYCNVLKTVNFDSIKRLSECLSKYEIFISGIMKNELISYRLPLSFVFLIGIGSHTIPDLKRIIGQDSNSFFDFYNFFINNDKHTREFFSLIYKEFQFKGFNFDTEDNVYKNIRLNVLKALFELRTENIRNNIDLERLKLTIETELKEELGKLEINNNSLDTNDSVTETINISKIVDTYSSYRYGINELINKIAYCVFNSIKTNKCILELNVNDESSLADFCNKTHDCDFILGGTIIFFGDNQKICKEVEKLLEKHKYIDTLLCYDERIDAFKDKISIAISNIHVSISSLKEKETREQLKDIENRALKSTPEEYSKIIKEDTILDYINTSMIKLELSCEIKIGLKERACYYTKFQLPK